MRCKTSGALYLYICSRRTSRAAGVIKFYFVREDVTLRVRKLVSATSASDCSLSWRHNAQDVCVSPEFSFFLFLEPGKSFTFPSSLGSWPLAVLCICYATCVLTCLRNYLSRHTTANSILLLLKVVVTGCLTMSDIEFAVPASYSGGSGFESLSGSGFTYFSPNEFWGIFKSKIGFDRFLPHSLRLTVSPPIECERNKFQNRRSITAVINKYATA